MTWNYSQDPSLSNRDAVRFLIGDTVEQEAKVTDKEIDWAILDQSGDLRLAAAVCLRAKAAFFSYKASITVGSVSKTGLFSVARSLSDRADELDPHGKTTGRERLALPVFGGRSISEKEELNADTDIVQPYFRRGQDDIPGGPDDVTDEDL